MHSISVDLLSLDPSTVLFCMGIFSAVMSLLARSVAGTLSKNILGLREWSNALLLFSLAFLTLYLRNTAASKTINYIVTLLFLTGVLHAVVAYLRYFSYKAPLYLIWVSGALSITGSTLWYIFDLDVRVAVLSVNVPVSSITLFITYLLIRRSGVQRHLLSTRMSILAGGLMTAGLLVRSVFVCTNDNRAIALYAVHGVEFWLLFLAAITVICASMGLILMAQERHKRDIIEHSRRDGLTGLLNRTAFFDSGLELDIEEDTAPYSVVMLDIDFFKKINDTYGHPVGDLAIVHVATIVANSIRSTDLAGRYGGEEFCILLRKCPKEKAGELATRLVSEVACSPLITITGQEIPLTISAGYAAHRDFRATSIKPGIKDLLNKADMALYRAKHHGRNQAQAAEPDVDKNED